ncbi:MoaD/ThiS family protein [Candidatus Margulisiibacteriota bacterium]
MSCTIKFPSPLLKYTKSETEFELEATTMKEAFNKMWEQFPELKDRFRNQDGSTNNMVNVYLNDNDIRSLKGLATEVKAGDEIFIIPIVAGG